MIASLEEVRDVQASGAASGADEYITRLFDAQMAIFFALLEISGAYIKLAHELNHIIIEAHTLDDTASK